MEAGHLPRRDPQHLLFLIWATTQHYGRLRRSVKALTGQGLDDPGFFAEARRTVLLPSSVGPEPGICLNPPHISRGAVFRVRIVREIDPGAVPADLQPRARRSRLRRAAPW